MAEPSAAERRLAAVLVADVSGYSRLVHEDEEATVQRLAELRGAIDAVIAEHGGRIVSSAGDGFLAAFGSALDAAAAALAAQRLLAERQRGVATEQQLRFRIGLNVGDVLAQQDDLFGDAINVAARLQELAEPGGIYASRALRDTVVGRLPCAFARVGRRQVKNIARPVTAYRLLPEGARAPTRWAPLAAMAAVLVVVIAAALWVVLPDRDDPAPTTPARSEARRAPTPPAPTPKPPPSEAARAPESTPATGSTAPPRQSIEGTAGDPDIRGRSGGQ